ncbi:hypothetical protein [Amycolatopsis magusensis]|uniref:PE family protein n=1 Tax=Amycolatopsis magusensis TaxID=882444 RepID=A0ABS4PI59_9PSEU|nr:hypothetical protein [Amycolatopsis magusensis]MBP2178610.1 hypothetical protein [Amycolatopsis magusensis]
MPDNGFTVVLDELARVADQAFPELAEIIGRQIAVLNSHEGLHGPGGGLPLVAHYQSTYVNYTDEIAARQRRGVEVVLATAEALRRIVGLYRRADGQG